MSTPTIAHVVNEFMAFNDLLDDAYWEASTMENKDLIYDIISMLNQEISELNKLSVQDHHYPYEIITEGILRVLPKVEVLEELLEEVIPRTKTMVDIREVMSNVLSILEAQTNNVSDF